MQRKFVIHHFTFLCNKNDNAHSLKSQLLRLVNEPELLPCLKQNIGLVSTFEEVAREHDEMYRGLLGVHAQE